MQAIPLQAVPTQSLRATLGGQYCRINLRTGADAAGLLYMDLLVNNAPILQGVVCRDRLRMVRRAYLGFSGDLMFLDRQGNSDPLYSGLADRFLLAYLAPGDL